jgi:hypothetical protein
MIHDTVVYLSIPTSNHNIGALFSYITIIYVSFFAYKVANDEVFRCKNTKKVVVTKRFWKINAIRPEIKTRRGRMRKFNLGQKANWRRLVKELGFQIVTRIGIEKVIKPPSKIK